MNENINKTPDNLVAKSGLLAGMNSIMAVASMTMILGFLGFTIIDVEYASEVFTKMKDFIIGSLGWFYVLVISGILFFVIWLLFSRFGNLKLGKDDDTPDFSTFSWICMLFSAGLGSGLIYWGVAEPIYHIQDNPFLAMAGVEPNSVEAAVVALRVTVFHWGLHGWALYVLVGLCLAYFSYRYDLPLTLRTALYPVLKDRIYGSWGHAIDLIGVFGTIFGLATSLGMGVVAINAGIENLLGFANNTPNQLIMIAIITAMGTASAASGVGKGVRILSEMNVWLSLLLLLAFLFLAPTAFILGLLITTTGDYLWNVIPMGFWIDSQPDRQWQSWWTIFYWGWWIAWCPFVGMFIARISKGRTVREFCTCVLIIPSSVVLLWMCVFGGGAIGIEMIRDGGIVEAVNADYALGVFKTIQGMSIEWLVFPLTCLTTFLLISWFVTSSDSGTLVMCTMLSMGNESPPIKFRIFWGVTSGVVGGVLLFAGGLNALQTASIVAGLPIAVMLIFMAYGLVKALNEDCPAPDVLDSREKMYLNR
ncbi:BCCT family transporter [Candidatus Spongiihabitans sp.]|uniref:BCCT family transporter n=1 Tax=Candidatus Spongiihabitans sp. TaxID=3101308 RepID=UPI003C6F4340